MKTKIKELRTAAGRTQQKLAYRMAQVFGAAAEELCCLPENKEREDREYAEPS